MRTIGHYEILDKLGEGGMGQVYRAYDTKLNRPVAVKLLSADVADPAARRRFQREAQMASSLNHPHIVTVHDAGEWEGLQYLVTEFVDGGTLKDWAAGRRRTWQEIVELLLGVADGIAAAHSAGITHRDIKPANILITKSGYAKLADFGLAKLVEQAARAAPDDPTRTLTEAPTRAGIVVGTIAYMSPEQASGQPVDSRSDVFSFGVVLYELLTGRKPFAGKTDLEVLQAIIHGAPQPLPEGVPPTVRIVMEKSLEKDPMDRYQSMREMVVDLRQSTEVSDQRRRARKPIGGFKWVWAGVPLVLTAVGFLAWRTWRPHESAQPLRAVPLTTLPGVHRYPSFSPDGDYVAFTWTGPRQDNTDIYVQQIGAGSPLRLTADPADDYSPAWSPDGRWIAFLRGQSQAGKYELRLIPPLGGAERKLAEIRPQGPLLGGWELVSLAWCPDSNCVVIPDSPGEGKPDALFVISLDSGEKRQLTHPQHPVAGDADPAVSPDGSWLVFRRIAAPYVGELYRLPLGTDLIARGEPSRLTLASLYANNPTWMPNGKEILFSARDGLWRSAVTGASKPSRLPFVGEDGLMPVVSHPQPGRLPRLAYVRSYADYNIWHVETSAPGAAASAPPRVAISSTRWEGCPQFSPDGRRVAFASDRSGENEIWLADTDGSNAVQLTSTGGNPGYPRWSSDGKWIAFHAQSEGQAEVFLIPAAGGRPRNLTSHPGLDAFPTFSPDGRWIYFSSNRARGDPVIWKIPSSGGEAVRVTNGIGQVVLVSPDGTFLYYVEAMDRPSPLWRLPVSGGVPVKVLEGVVQGNFTVLDRGVYYIDQASGGAGVALTDRPSDEARLQYFEFATGRPRTVARNLGKVASASPPLPTAAGSSIPGWTPP